MKCVEVYNFISHNAICTPAKSNNKICCFHKIMSHNWLTLKFIFYSKNDNFIPSCAHLCKFSTANKKLKISFSGSRKKRELVKFAA